MKDKRRPDDKDIKDIIDNIEKLEKLEELDIKSIADENGYSSRVASKLRGMKTSQLRRFFGAIKSIERKIEEDDSGDVWDKVEAEFYLLKPKIAYAKGRKLIPDDFYQVLLVSMNKINVGSNEDKIANFKRFVQFLESIVAYHKFYGGD